MSHDFAFWDSDEPLESEEAGAIYYEISRNGVSEKIKPSTKVAILARDIQSRWPPPDPGREDEWPLAGPLEVSESYLIICLIPSRLCHLADPRATRERA